MNIYTIRRRFIFAQAFVFLIALLYEYCDGISINYTFILLYSLWNGLSYMWLFFKELKYAPDFHPFQILALVTAQFIGFSGLRIYKELADGETLYFGSTIIDDAIYLGVMYLALQHIILFGVFFYLENKHEDEQEYQFTIADRICSSEINYMQWGLRFYVFVWIMRAVSFVVPLASISSILVNVTSMGHIVTLLLLTFAMLQSPTEKEPRVWHWLIVILEIILVLNHGMKEEIIRSLVPYCVFLLISYKAGYSTLQSSQVVHLCLIAAFVILFVFPYVSIFRTLSINTGRSWDQITTSEALVEYGKYIDKEGIYANDEDDRGVDYLMSRAGSIGCNAFSIDYTKKNGIEPAYFALCISALIPRIFWPEKPPVVIGGMAYALATGDSNWRNIQEKDTYGTSVSLGYIGSLYLSIGLLGAIFVIFLQAFLIWYLWNFFKKILFNNIVAIWSFSGIIFVLLKDFEAFQDCGLNFCVFNILYMLICKYLYKGNNNEL